MQMISGLLGALDRVSVGLGAQSRDDLEAAALDLLAENEAMLSLQEGEHVADFQLTDVHGDTQSLTGYLAQGPVVLTFYRGGWCGYCQSYLSALNTVAPQIVQTSAWFVAISPQTLEASAATALEVGHYIHMLSDPGNQVARRFGLVYELPEAFRQAYAKLGIDLPRANGDRSFELPVPATYIIGEDSRIEYGSVDVDYTRRPDPHMILERLRAHMSKWS